MHVFLTCLNLTKKTKKKNTYEDYGIHLNQEKLAEYENKGLKVDILEGL